MTILSFFKETILSVCDYFTVFLRTVEKKCEKKIKTRRCDINVTFFTCDIFITLNQNDNFMAKGIGDIAMINCKRDTFMTKTYYNAARIAKICRSYAINLKCYCKF